MSSEACGHPFRICLRGMVISPRLISVLIVAILVLGACDGSTLPSDGLPLNSGPAPWPPPERPAERIKAARLPPYEEDGPLHFHSHLDIFVDGRPVPVPASLGLRPPYSPLHTHSPSGILHVETNDRRAVFTLGHLFALWGVRLTPDCVGSYCTPGKGFIAYVNGKPSGHSLSRIPLAPYREIALVIGVSPTSIPDGYDCYNAAEIERRSCEGFLTEKAQ